MYATARVYLTSQATIGIWMTENVPSAIQFDQSSLCANK